MLFVFDMVVVFCFSFSLREGRFDFVVVTPKDTDFSMYRSRQKFCYLEIEFLEKFVYRSATC